MLVGLLCASALVLGVVLLAGVQEDGQIKHFGERQVVLATAARTQMLPVAITTSISNNIGCGMPCCAPPCGIQGPQTIHQFYTSSGVRATRPAPSASYPLTAQPPKEAMASWNDILQVCASSF